MKIYLAMVLLLIAGCRTSEETGREQQIAEAENDAVRQIEKLGGTYERNSDGNVVVVELKHQQQKTPDFGWLRNLPHLQRLYLQYSQITDASLVNLQDLKNLQRLSLHGTPITPEGLKYLSALSNLEALDLGETSNNHNGLVHLRGLTKLRELNLGYVGRLGIPEMAHLANLKRLEVLRFKATKIDDDAFWYLGQLTNLKYLALQRTGIDDAGLQQLMNLSNNSRLTSVFLSKLCALQELRKLDLTYTSVDDTGMRYIRALTKLESLTLGDNRIRGEGLIDLENMTQLKELTLWNSWIPTQFIARLRKSLPECKITAVDD